MRHDLLSFVEKHPPKFKIPAHLFMSPAYAALCIAFLTSAAAYAAELSLPQTLLYPLKTEVLEPIRYRLLAFTPADSARVEQALVERRLEEAHTLAKRGSLTPAIARTLSSQVSDNTQRAERSIQSVTKGGNLGEALTLGSSMESTLSVHEETLQDSSGAKEIVDDLKVSKNRLEQTTRGIESRLRDSALPDQVRYIDATRNFVALLMEKSQRSLNNSQVSSVERNRAYSCLMRALHSRDRAERYVSAGNEAAALSRFKLAAEYAQECEHILSPSPAQRFLD